MTSKDAEKTQQDQTTASHTKHSASTTELPAEAATVNTGTQKQAAANIQVEIINQRENIPAVR